MKKTKATTTDLRNKAREARKTPLSEARYLSASDVTDPHALIEDLHIYRMELEAQNQELQRIQGELEAVLERYRNLYDFAPVGYLTCDKEGRIQEINLTLCRLLGTTRDAFIEASFYDYVHEQDRDTLYLHLRKLYREKGRRADEFRLVTKKKRVIWVYVESVLEQHSAKGVACRMGLTDITQLKETQQELAESEARFRTLTEHAPDIISRYDRNLRYLYVNPAIEPVADIPARGFIGKSDKELGMPEEFCKRWTEILRRVFKTGQPQTAELDFATANGKRTFELRAVPEEGVEGSIESVMGTAREITERKQAEDTLRRSKELSAALNRINDVMHSSLDSEEIMQQLVSEGARALNCETATLSLRRKKDWVVRYVHGMPDNLVGSVMHDEEERHAVLALETGQPVAVSDAFNDGRFNREHLHRHNIRSVLAVPLIAGGRPLGIIFFNYNSTVHPFADEEVGFARQLSVAASIALENARLYEEQKRAEEALRQARDTLEIRVQERTAELVQANKQLREENAERLRAEHALRLESARLDALLRLSRMSEVPLDEITAFTLEQAIALTQSKIGFVGFLSEDEAVYTLHAVSKDVVTECAVVGDPVHWPVPEAGIWADAIRERKTLFVNDYGKPNPRKHGIPAGHVSMERFMVVPVLEGKRIVALAGVGNKASDYDKSDERQVALLLSGMWGSVQKNRAREELQKAHDELEEKVTLRTAELSASNEALQKEITEHKRTEEAVRQSEERYRGLYEAVSGGVIVQDRNGTIIESNPMARDMLGLTREQIEGLSAQDPPWQAISEDGSPLPGDNHPSMRVLRTGIPVEGQVIGVFNPIIEQYRWLLINTEPILDPKTSQVRGTVSTFLDITDRKMREEELHRLNRTLRALSNSSQAMMRATDESAYMQEVCKIIVEDCGHKMVWIGLVEEDEAKSVRPAAYAGFEQGYLETLRITWADSERGRGPTGTAIRKGRVSMCRNMLTDPNFAPWREQAINRGYASSIVLPLLAEGKAFGAINIYSQDPDPFSEDEVTLLSELADDLAHGITTLRLRAAQAKAEEALRASETRLSRAQEIAHLGSWELDVMNRHLSWSDEVYRIFNLNPQEFGATYEAFLECVHPDDRAAVDAAYSTSLQEGRDTYDVEHRVIRKDTGEIRIVHERCEHRRDAAGRIIRSIGMVHDITERKQAEQALQKAHDELETRVQERTAELRNTTEVLEKTMASLVDAVFVVEPVNRTIIACNKAVETIFGYPEGEVIGRNTEFLYVNRAMYEEFGRELFPALDAKEVYHTEYKMRRKDGTVFPSDITVTEMLDDSGRRTGTVSLVRDLTERVQAERDRVQLGKVIEEAIEDRLRLAVVMEQTAEGVMIFDIQRTIEYVNPALERLSGYRRGELIGRRSDMLLPYAEAGEAMETVRRGVSWRGQVIRRHKRGDPLELDIIMSPVRNIQGEIINYVAIERDVTHEMQLQRQMRQMQKIEALGTLAGGIAHDLNNILMPITINTELALDIAPEESPARLYLQQALEAAHRGTDLVRQITTFSRRKEQTEASSKIVPAIKEVLTLLRSTLPATIEIRRNLEAGDAVVKVDPIHIHQVLMNLCSNAADAMSPEGGLLKVSLAAIELDADAADTYLDLKPGPYVRLTVADTGHGMEEAVKERIFDPFFTTKGPRRGTGMGLAVVHGIVKGVEGGIRVYSEKGKGTQFDVYFPQVQGLPKRRSTASAPPPTGTERILFVDDEEAIVRSVRPLLERLGYRVTTAINSPEALEVFRSQPEAFDLVITDQIMPRMTGIDLAEEIMRIRPGMPVILCTGFSEQISKKDIKARGIRAFIMKPLTTKGMAEIIRHALDGVA
jgi:PAS domain S-box-containing protein